MANMNQFKLIMTQKITTNRINTMKDDTSYRFKQKSELQKILFNQQDSNSRSERYYTE